MPEQTVEDPERIYRAVRNDEEQYSVWPVTKELPSGWLDAGKQGTRSECLDWIATVWTDMRPRSLRLAMERDAAAPPPDPGAEPEPPADDLVARLSAADGPVRFGGPAKSAAELGRRITDLGYVTVEFVDTRGSTALGIVVDAAATDLSTADFAAGSGRIHLEGTLELNWQPVRCVATLDLASQQGTGRLVPTTPGA